MMATDQRSIMETLNSTLGHLGLIVGPEDFSHPSAQRVQLICRAFIVHVFEVPDQNLLQLPFDALSEEDHAEDYTRAAPLIMIYTTMQNFVQDMNNDNGLFFRMCDLVSPQPKTFRSLMSFLADYLKFHTAMMPHWEATCSIYDDKRKRLTELQKEIEETSSKRDALSKELDSRKRREHELMTVLGKKQQDLQVQFARSQELEAAHEINKKNSENSKFEQNELTLEKESLQMQMEQLALQIVASPERVFRERDQYRQELAHAREQEEKQRKENEEVKAQMAMAATVRQYIEKIGGEVQMNILSEQGRLEGIILKRLDAQQMKREVESRLQMISNNIKTIECEIRTFDENLNRDKQLHLERKNELAIRKAELEQELAGLKHGNINPAVDRQLAVEISNILLLKTEVIHELRANDKASTELYQKLLENVDEERKAHSNECVYYAKIIKEIGKMSESPPDLNETINQSVHQL